MPYCMASVVPGLIHRKCKEMREHYNDQRHNHSVRDLQAGTCKACTMIVAKDMFGSLSHL